ncbi:TM2 domain-containing protein [Mangrovimonas sp. AS39]|uniref:TM2 domain-containing protein n=1 Tax=Mangrovimonas futianensis TaxID=2895523 RepID=UPI001E61C16A|nr:TM2 domain-containing protein [Mangrovimonas futianensis]MCF1190132.1 TM2 domain-containing protein [Mangrovimonas futianensis]MCF1194117.1 TM2 domain-containing protein [Mangrovimonas futianensis]
MDNKKDLRDELDDLIGDFKEGAKKASDKADEFSKDAKEKAKDFAHAVDEAFDRATGNNKKVLAGILAILLGGFGAHKFVLGYVKEGIILLMITLVISIMSFGFLSFLVWIFTLIEGIIYLTKSDEEFYMTYQVEKRPWF